MSVLDLPIETLLLVFPSIGEVLRFTVTSTAHYDFLNQGALWEAYCRIIGINSCTLSETGKYLRFFSRLIASESQYSLFLGDQISAWKKKFYLHSLGPSVHCAFLVRIQWAATL